jgi:hypothetical protein
MVFFSFFGAVVDATVRFLNALLMNKVEDITCGADCFETDSKK